VVPYEALEKHEITCGNQLVKCIRCQLGVLRKNLAQHQPVCQQTTAMSLDSNMVHVTCENDFKERNSEIAALKAEVQLLRQALNGHMELLVARDILADNNVSSSIALRGQ
ncbi:unnamed protein product, partial [Rotaria sp. Silwood1]